MQLQTLFNSYSVSERDCVYSFIPALNFREGKVQIAIGRLTERLNASDANSLTDFMHGLDEYFKLRKEPDLALKKKSVNLPEGKKNLWFPVTVDKGLEMVDNIANAFFARFT